ncbi:Holin of 3TMs, for gene-transfer release [Aliiroseovarius halocynthiae]|uniref:Carboxylesterase n=1 Tax=Aliiroseovarius halocynthiae TaxID=985055 RepID=A0A545SUW8_9RHOB|nr:holin family protein [Aliiroseovarius halocynthiae]TQV68758.1 carboxylesterase [Aliiroseovarius halocynthiae]SMR71182.1 Holin of 3TMs, for gene-transfer release [Aliiroseovarius halocynthiae]
MGLMGGVFNVLFGGRGNVVRETAEVFRENAEAASARDAGLQMAAIEAFAAEFAHARKGWFDRFMDGLNRVPRPALALSTLGLFAAAMVDPVWFAARMQGVALVPEPLWWLMGAIVSFYFGARQQVKGQEFQRSIAEVLIKANGLRAASDDPLEVPQAAVQIPEGAITHAVKEDNVPREVVRGSVDVTGNAALKDWMDRRNGK